MNLKVYERNGNERVVTNLRSLLLEFNRNVYHAEYVAPNGVITHENGEIDRLFPAETEMPNFLLGELKAESAVSTFTNPTTESTAHVTGAGDKKEDKPADEKTATGKSTADIMKDLKNVKTESAVGGLTNPITVDTSNVSNKPDSTVSVTPDTGQGRQSFEVDR